MTCLSLVFPRTPHTPLLPLVMLHITASLWSHLDLHQVRFSNPLFVPHGEILPSSLMVTRNVTLWSEYFLRWAPLPSVMSSSTPAHTYLPLLGPISINTVGGPTVRFTSRGHSEAAHSVGANLSADTAFSDVEWTGVCVFVCVYYRSPLSLSITFYRGLHSESTTQRAGESQSGAGAMHVQVRHTHIYQFIRCDVM